jgi:FixJ family two-component response regulator
MDGGTDMRLYEVDNYLTEEEREVLHKMAGGTATKHEAMILHLASRLMKYELDSVMESLATGFSRHILTTP